MSYFMNWYTERARSNKSMLCVGLDPTLEQLPPQYGPSLNPLTIRRWIADIIDIAADKAACVKPQWAFYNALGEWGYDVLQDIVEYAHFMEVPVIEDAKVSDIGSTMEAYGKAIFEQHAVDAVTFVPYLGSTFLDEDNSDLWAPYFKQGCGIIPMILTSNPEANQLQLVEMSDGRPLYMHTAELVATWAQQVEEISEGRGMVGGVVGATYPKQAEEIRQIVGPDMPFLVPGMGAQGGTGETAMAGMPDSGEPILFINSSRAIMGAWRDKESDEPKDGDPLDHVEAAIDEHNQRINDALTARFGSLELVYG